VSDQGIGIQLLDAAVTRKGDPRAHLYIDDFTAPGTTLVRHVKVSDLTRKPVHLLLYADASSVDKLGWQVADGHATNELTSWMTVTPSSVDLQPGASASAVVTIAVPPKASSDERYATVVAELPASAPTASRQVSVATRVGVRVYLAVGPGGEPRSDFTVSTLTASRDKDGTPEVTAQVTNTGRRALDVGGALTLANGPGGLRAGPYDASVPRTIGIGDTEGVVVRLDKQTPAGPWLAKVVLRSGYVQHAVTATLSFPAAAGASAAPVRATSVPLTANRNVLVPVALGLIGLGLIVLVVFVLRRRRRRDDDEVVHPGPDGLPAVPSQRAAARGGARTKG
jgi:hypothetical protein